jgi:formate hydrogenlyase subunit 5
MTEPTVVEVAPSRFALEVARRTAFREQVEGAPVAVTLAMLSMRPTGRAGASEVEALFDGPGGWTAVRAAWAADLAWPSEAGVRATLAEETRLRALAAHSGAPGLRQLGADTSVGGQSTFVFPVGPVRGDVMESVALRLTGMGDEVLALTVELGYKVRHVEAAARGASAAEAVRVVERATGTSTVAHALAFSQAVEAACGVTVPPYAGLLRSVLQEFERVHSHLWDLANLAASTGLPVAQQELMAARETVLRAAASLCGHRLLRGLVTPGGLTRDPGLALWRDAIAHVSALRPSVEAVMEDLARTPSFLDRLAAAGVVLPEEARAGGGLGPVGRASGAGPDARAFRPYAGYVAQPPAVLPQAIEGDALARWRVRTGELEAAFAWLVGAGPLLTGGEVAAPVRAARGVGVGWAEGPRGEIVYLVESDAAGRVARVSARTPSMRNWLLMPAAVRRNNVLQDVPIIDASFALSVAGADL